MTEHRELIAKEVLATSTEQVEDASGLGFSDDEVGFAFSVAKV